MRFIPVLLMAVALATSAGCFGKDDESDGTDPTPTTPTGTTGGTTPTGATPTTTPTSPTTGGNSSTPVKPAPKNVFSGNADFTPQPPAGAPSGVPSGTVRPNPFSVTPAGYTKLMLNVTWALSGPAGVAATGISVVVADAAGTAIVTCAGPNAGPIPSVPAACMAEGNIPATVGDYVVNYIGDGTVSAAVTVDAA